MSRAGQAYTRYRHLAWIMIALQSLSLDAARSAEFSSLLFFQDMHTLWKIGDACGQGNQAVVETASAEGVPKIRQKRPFVA